jgi:cell division protein ZapB
LTGKVISNKLAAMNGNLDSLEQKIGQVLAMCGQLRDENRTLRDRLAGLEQQKQVLAGRMDAARSRLEILIEKLPQE